MKQLSFLITFVASFLFVKAQQVNGVFTPFANNNQWGNTSVNSVKVESNGSLTLNGFYEGGWSTGISMINGYYEKPNKYPFLCRLNSNGTVQTSFGGLDGGGTLLDFLNSSGGSCEIDRSYGFTDGFFLVAGHWDNGQGFLTKCTTSGSRPTAFNGGAIIRFPEPAFTSKTYIEDWIVTTGVTFTVRMDGVLADAQKIIVTAYNNTTGLPVSTFGINGSTEIRVTGYSTLEHYKPVKLARDSDGKLYIGFTQIFSEAADNIMLYRLNNNGIVDSAFGNTAGIGYNNFPVPRPYALTSLSANTNGTVTMGGHHYPQSNDGKVSFINYNPATEVQTSTYFNVPANQVGVGAGSKTMAAVLDANNGNERTVFSVAYPFAANRYRIFIQAYDPDNINAGLTLTPWVYPGAVSTEPTGMERLSDGSFIVVGKMTRQNGTTVGVVIKYKSDGTIDNTFGEQGAFIMNGREGGSPWADVTQMPDNKYLAVGAAGFVPGEPTNRAILLNRFNANGSIDTSFGTNGTVYAYQTEHYGRSVIQAQALGDGRCLLGGSYTNYGGEVGIGTNTSAARAAMYRVKADGTPDSTFGYFGRFVFSGYTGLTLVGFKVVKDSIFMGGNGSTAHTGNSKAFIYHLTPDGLPAAAPSYTPMLTSLQTFTISELTGYAYAGGGLTGAIKKICKVKRPFNQVGGKPDSTFGTNGLVDIPIINSGEQTTVKDIKLIPGALLVTTDWAQSSSANATKGVFFTFISQEGVVQTNFGNNGNKFLQLPGATSIIGEIYKWTPDGTRLLIFGEAIVSGQTKGFICKINLNGDLDTAFGTAGVLWTAATYEDKIAFDRSNNMIAIQKYGLLGGGALAKLIIPQDVYTRMKTGSWTGAINNDWFNAGNWAEAMVPDANTEVVIANGSSVISANKQAFAYSVRVLAGASLEVGVNSSLSITQNN